MKRRCSKCGSEKTYIDPSGKEIWCHDLFDKSKYTCKRCYRIQYRKLNPEKIKHQKIIDYKKHKDNYRKLNKKWIKNNRKRKNELARKYCQKYPERRKITKKKWEENNRQHHHILHQKILEKQAIVFNLTANQYVYKLRLFATSTKHRFHNKCAICGKKSSDIHHLIHRSIEPRLSFVENNGIALCKICHYQAHGTNLLVNNLSYSTLILVDAN